LYAANDEESWEALRQLSFTTSLSEILLKCAFKKIEHLLLELHIQIDSSYLCICIISSGIVVFFNNLYAKLI